MPKSEFGKERLLEVLRYLWVNSDETHKISASALISHLTSLHPESRVSLPSIYSDLRAINEVLGDYVEIRSDRGRGNAGSYVCYRLFEDAEVKILIDSVQSSRFISKAKTEQLIRKLEMLCSRHTARSLHHDIALTNRIKTPDESVLITVDAISRALESPNAISFVYKEYDTRFHLQPRTGPGHPEGVYIATPRALIWSNENYYLLGFDHTREAIVHYRVDKMSRIRDAGIRKTANADFWAIDLSSYDKKLFGMFSGQTRTVRIRFDKELTGAAADVLGQQITVIPQDDSHFTVTVDLVPSEHFLGWIFALGDKAEILSPSDLRQEMARRCREAALRYADNI